MIDLLRRSREIEDFVLDTPFTPEEIESVLRNLKLGKSAGYDQVQPEHLKYGGPALYIWIKQVANAMIELECVPESLKVGIVTRVVVKTLWTETAIMALPYRQFLPRCWSL